MPHVTDYIQWRGDIPFENDPLNEVDNLIFCLLSYVELDGAVPSTPDRCVTLREAAKEYFFTHDPKDERRWDLSCRGRSLRCSVRWRMRRATVTCSFVDTSTRFARKSRCSFPH